jgi:hypothetical protein
MHKKVSRLSCLTTVVCGCVGFIWKGPLVTDTDHAVQELHGFDVVIFFAGEHKNATLNPGNT